MSTSCSPLKTAMSHESLKVALLARAGLARDRLREVIDRAGAQCVLEADPAELDPAGLAGCTPKVVLVALDPQTEDALEAFDEVLANPDLEVIYEEASLAVAREGWDIARWQRHLVAKMQSHNDVLPPGTEQDLPDPAPDSSFAGVEWSLDVVTDDGHATTDEGLAPPPSPAMPAVEAVNPFDPVQAETTTEGDPVPTPSTFEPGDVADGLDPGLMFEAVAAEADAGIDADAELAAAPQLDTEAADVVPASTGGGFGTLSLDDGSASLAADADAESKGSFARDISDLEARISGLTLVDDSPKKEPEGARGAVLVVAGLGGPDAVRQLVAAMPEGFPRPVLIQQRLDGGRHDKLVAQMQRATGLPVRLAEAGQYAQAGFIYILPAELGVDVAETGIRFDPDGGLVDALPAADSAVLLLSGSDPSLVDAALKQGWAGALVAGQAAEGCYDAAASSELATRGGDTATPAEIAKRLAERWPA